MKIEILIFLYGQINFLIAALMKNKQEPKKIAIIGGGIGGTSCAIFLRELVGSSYVIKIDLYEQNEFFGGRLKIADHKGKIYETGGSMIHIGNYYINKFAKKFDLKRILPLPRPRTFVYENENIISLSDPTNKSQNQSTVRKLSYLIKKILKEFSKIYEIQEKQKQTFETVDKLFKSIGPNFSKSFRLSIKNYLKTYGKFSDREIDTLVGPAVMVNYGQTVDIPAFTGFVSLAGYAGKSFSIADGNYQIPERCFLESGADLYRARVIEIQKSGKKFLVSFIDKKTKKKNKKTYDYVIVATPLVRNDENIIKFSKFKKYSKENHGIFQKSVSTLLEGELKPEFFISTYETERMRKGKLVEGENVHIIEKNADSIIRFQNGYLDYIISKMKPAKDSENHIWKILTRKKLGPNDIEKMFKVKELIAIHQWFGYPQYLELKKFPIDRSFILDDNLFYINCIEWAASCMEMSVIGAKNVALLIYKIIYKIK